MKKYIFIAAIAFLYHLSLNAQTQSLQVIYVTKDYSTETAPLCRELRDIYNMALADKSQAVVFYQANLSNPIIVRVNLPDDNREDMDKFLASLVTKSETMIDPATDLKRIVGIFDKAEVKKLRGQRSFRNVEMIYYVTPTFWSLNFNESIISSVYFALGLDEDWAKDYVSMSVYHCHSDELTVNQDAPFGKKKLCGDQNLLLLTY